MGRKLQLQLNQGDLAKLTSAKYVACQVITIHARLWPKHYLTNNGNQSGVFLTLTMLNFLNGIIHHIFWHCPLSFLGISR